MNTRLEQLLASIAPDRTLEELGRRVDAALNTFDAPSQITNWEEFRSCLVRLVSHVESHLLRLPWLRSPDATLDLVWGRCSQALMRIYGSSGEKAAFEMARTGNQGGMLAVSRKLAQVLADQFAENEIAAKVGVYWEGLPPDDRLADAAEYLGRYGHLLPSELTEGSAARIRANFPKVLEEHPRLLRRLRGIGRS